MFCNMEPIETITRRKTERQTDGRTGGRVDGQTDTGRQTDIHISRQTVRKTQADRWQTVRQTYL